MKSKRRPTSNRCFSTSDVSRMSGATLRQLQWWDERGYLTTPILGGIRRYGSHQVRIAMVLSKRLANPAVVSMALSGLSEEELESAEYVAIVKSPDTMVCAGSASEICKHISALGKPANIVRMR